jgi:hypothetical protein
MVVEPLFSHALDRTMEQLDLNDPRWRELPGTYSDGPHIAEQLSLLTSGQMKEEEEERFWQELCHEYESTPAGYASIPHLISLAEKVPAGRALFVLAMAGHVLACAERSASHRVPEFLKPSLRLAANRALKKLSSLIGAELPHSTANTKALAYTIAAFRNEPRLHFKIEGLDC